MRIIEMHPGEEGVVPAGVQPRDRLVSHKIGPPLRRRGRSTGRDLTHVVTVHVKAPIKPETRVQHHAGDKRAGIVPMLPKGLRQRGKFLAQHESPVVTDAVLLGIHPGEQ